jgi:hypothetical protein
MMNEKSEFMETKTAKNYHERLSPDNAALLLVEPQNQN